MRLRILRDCWIDGAVRAAGEVVEVHLAIACAALEGSRVALADEHDAALIEEHRRASVARALRQEQAGGPYPRERGYFVDGPWRPA